LSGFATNVRYWHKADITIALTNVRYWGKSGHRAETAECQLLTQSGHSVLKIAVMQNEGWTPFRRSEIPDVMRACWRSPGPGQAMRRRNFIKAIAGLGAVWPLSVYAQQPMPVVGLIGTATGGDEVSHLVAGFLQGLKEVGFVEGQNVSVEYRWAQNQYDRLPALADDLVHRQVKVIAATSSPAVWEAAKAATATIPIVFQGGGDPVKLGLVASLRQPGGNATGVVNMSAELNLKRLEILRELVPTATQIAILSHTAQPTAEPQVREVAAAARNMHEETFVVNASNEHEIDEAFAIFVQRHAGALFVISDSLFTNRRQQLVALAAKYVIPAMYAFREFPTAGGLISYGANLVEEWRKTGVYVGRILKGEKPADLPIQEPTKFELVINLKTAKALGLNVSRDFLLRADEVIE